MSTDPFVANELDDLPRQEPNLAPGVTIPAARPWVPDRPGDEVSFGQPRGELLGVPGPNIGYALTLAHRASDRLALAPHEPVEDVIAVVGEVAMKRAASYGRAPVMADVECAALVLGYQGGCPPAFAAWRAHVVVGAHHEYPIRRAFVDAIDIDALRLAPQVLAGRVGEVRATLREAVTRELGPS